jgi:Bacterial protein of unknown function (DUF937)
MALNLVSLVSQFITPVMINRIAGALGINPGLAQTIISAAIPSVLGGLGNVAATPNGAKAISSAVSNQDPDLLGSLTKAIGGAGQGDMLNMGSNMLGSLIGANAVGGLAGALGKFAGADANAAKGVLGLVTPAIMGTLGQQDPENWSDGNGIANLFASQKSAIAAAMPPGLGSILSSAGIPGIGGMATGAAAAATAAAASATSAARDMRNTAASAVQPPSGLPSWLLPALAVVVLGLLAWWFLGRSSVPEKMAEKAPAAVATPAAPAAVSADVADVGKQATSAIALIGGTLSTITNADTATAALPKLKEASASLDKVTGMADKIPAEAKTGLKAAVGPLKDMIGKVTALPGVGEIIKSTTDPLLGKLDALVK